MSSSMYPSGFSPPYMLRVNTRTWMRDSHDLFDYETHQQLKVSNFATSAAFKLLRCEADVSVMEYNNMVDKEHDHLLSIVSKKNGEYIVVPAEKIPGSLLYPQKLWLIVRTLPYQRYALQENDIIKLGRFRLRVKQLVPAPSSDTPNSTSTGDVSTSDPASDAQLVKLFDGIIPEKTISFEEQCNMQCRICLADGYLHNPSSGTITSGNTPTNLMSTSNETSIDLDTATSKINNGSINNSNQDSNTSSITTVSDLNFRSLSNVTDLNVNRASFDTDRLICACECKGSIKYVHVDCLRKWIDSRWNLKSDEPLPPMVFIREVSCELCKTNYPCFIRQNGELIQIVKMPKMAVPFLVLENITPHALKGVHLLSMKDMKDLKLGRGHESDVRIPDVSISRYHATIRYEQGQFFLEDHDSKFGTLVAMRKPKLVSINEPLSVQVGRSVINLSIDESLPYLQNSVITLTPSVNVGALNNDEHVGADSSFNLSSTNLMASSVNEGSRVMLTNISGMVGTNSLSGVNGITSVSGITGLSGMVGTGSGNGTGINGMTGHSSHSDNIMPLNLNMLDYSLGNYNYPSYLTSYTNQIQNTGTVSNNSSQMSISPSPTVSSSNTPNNLITGNVNNEGSRVMLASDNIISTPTSVMSTNLNVNNLMPSSVNNSNGMSGNTNNSSMNDLYWTMVRNATRHRYDTETDMFNNNNNMNNMGFREGNNNMSNIDINNNRLNSYRHHITSSSRGSQVGLNNSTQLLNTVNTSQVITNPIVSSNSEDVDMLLPESVFIANWNNLPTRNVDLNVDTSTSALEHRHTNQDLDKPITRL